MMQIIDDNQYKALSFVSFANRGGNRPKEIELREWMLNPGPKPGRRGRLVKRGRPAKYETVGGIYDTESFRNLARAASNIIDNSTLTGIRKIGEDWQRASAGILSANVYSILGTRRLIEPEIPDEYGPDVPAESFVQHLIRLGWIDQDDQGGLGLTPLGRALLRSEDASEGESDAYDVVVLDAQNELSYPVFIQRLAEAGEAILIDPYLRIEQLLAIRAYTSISRVLVSSQLRREDRAAMAVLIESGTGRPIELRMADHGVLHDRMVIGTNSAFTIGTSINTIGKQHPTILTPLPVVAADVMRTHVDKWWNEAQTIATYPPVEEEPPED
ncbi:hypothetical protein MUY14_12200 [Amycolatopsis sp. FBCC-B4732]|uniref:hypothetical protein n=1 Tax=Amycolatopsis sp. FBCC-B4732 TaxID=3079339 RepID=UPI001FF27652|nr:hypothetical protein [Amycolatopsis sp. FBCC-B4732]UOX91341.1 hypothetical protein MUY14_12200 [Amycolatopsis sp. FBCC-B4732]